MIPDPVDRFAGVRKKPPHPALSRKGRGSSAVPAEKAFALPSRRACEKSADLLK